MVLGKAAIRESEKFAVQSGAFSWNELMGIAGEKAADIIMEKFPVENKKITVICGSGNNGGDGFVIAERLASFGAEVSVLMPLGLPKTESALYYYKKLFNANKTNELPQGSDIIIDALFGIGLDRELDGKACGLLEEINKKSAVKIAVDIPSGVEADSGKILGNAFNADLTITFIALKPCFLLPPALDICGEVVVADIGVKPLSPDYFINSEPDFPKRKKNTHKGTYGTALTLCGSYGMAGALILASGAALRSGVGILKAAVCDGIYAPFTAAVPEAVCVPIKQNSLGTLSPAYMDIDHLLNGVNAVLIGCGMGKNRDTAELLKLIIRKAEVPLVIDADGINVLADSIDIIKNIKAPIILTPHPAELARLLNKTTSEIEADRISAAGDTAKSLNCILVLKGPNTIIAEPDGKITFNTTGNSGMATGGSGDVLSGITVSLLAQGFTPEFSAKAAVFLHGKAGDKALIKRGERALLPSDIIEAL